MQRAICKEEKAHKSAIIKVHKKEDCQQRWQPKNQTKPDDIERRKFGRVRQGERFPLSTINQKQSSSNRQNEGNITGTGVAYLTEITLSANMHVSCAVLTCAIHMHGFRAHINITNRVQCSRVLFTCTMNLHYFCAFLACTDHVQSYVCTQRTCIDRRRTPAVLCLAG